MVAEDVVADIPAAADRCRAVAARRLDERRTIDRSPGVATPGLCRCESKLTRAAAILFFSSPAMTMPSRPVSARALRRWKTAIDGTRRALTKTLVQQVVLWRGAMRKCSASTRAKCCETDVIRGRDR